MKMLDILFILGALGDKVASDLIAPIPLSNEIIKNVALVNKPSNDAISACLSLQWNYCQTEFNSLLGLNPLYTWRNGTAINKEVNSLLRISTTEIVKVCNQRTKYYQCLGTSYFPCMNLFNILDTSNPDFQNAFDYTRTFLGLDFMCSAGFEEVVNQWKCLSLVQTTKDYANCLSSFSYSLSPDNFCIAVDTTAKCLNKVYSEGCRDSGAGYYGCESFRYTFDQTCWGIRCTIGTN